jgi:hypothetical protein
MEAVQVQLPPELVQRLRQEVASEEALNQVVAEAVQMWLERRRAERVQQEVGLRLLRDAGLAMDGARQRALADAIMPPFVLRTYRVVSKSKLHWHGSRCRCRKKS